MSKIGNQTIEIPKGVEVKISGDLLSAKGPKGELSQIIPFEIKAEIKENNLSFSIARQSKRSAALWGLIRALAANMIWGVEKGFSKNLEIQGIGYKAALQGKDLIFNLGFSHPVKFDAVPGIDFKIEKNIISVSGISKELVGQTAANIRALKEPEPYKGKGIRYQGEMIKLKAGKKAVKEGF
ncbi:MAG: 50S ribosomal protein L6 [Parcubacteria group bacterium GW2011_GWC1_43_12]|nr:MAG: 50S ribosomal protein L6 [Parcubacteria group bacterium GW2011_GWB1_42_6]KKS92152.1 MAG: 50S ribosomal protein L6 [Parcubacteria group bacterium GW2011_GWC1_43_12]